MKAATDMVLTRDRRRVVPLGDPEGDPLAWVASKGEEIPEIEGVTVAQERPKAKASSKKGASDADGD